MYEETKAGASKQMPAKIVIYGEPKTGKTTFAAQADDVFFINVEGGLDYLPNQVRSTPHITSWKELQGWLNHIFSDDSFTCGTIVIDSLDWVERIIQDERVKQEGAESITDSNVKAFAFYKGVSECAEQAMKVFKWLDAIYKKKKIPAIIIAHSQVKNIDLPSQEPYSRHQMKMSKALSAKTEEWADLILMAGYSFHVDKDGKAISEPKRVLFAGGSAAWVGGGRMPLPKEMPLNYDNLKKEIEK